jgi:hypothetical protein
MTLMSAFEKAERELRLRGVILRRMDGEGYQVSVGNRVEMFPPEEFDRAVETGREMPVPAPQGAIRKGRRRRPKSAKQARRWWIKNHNKHVRFAGNGKLG